MAATQSDRSGSCEEPSHRPQPSLPDWAQATPDIDVGYANFVNNCRVVAAWLVAVAIPGMLLSGVSSPSVAVLFVAGGAVGILMTLILCLESLVRLIMGGLCHRGRLQFSLRWIMFAIFVIAAIAGVARVWRGFAALIVLGVVVLLAVVLELLQISAVSREHERRP